jgi:hypothetical protein
MEKLNISQFERQKTSQNWGLKPNQSFISVILLFSKLQTRKKTGMKKVTFFSVVTGPESRAGLPITRSGRALSFRSPLPLFCH